MKKMLSVILVLCCCIIPTLSALADPYDAAVQAQLIADYKTRNAFTATYKAYSQEEFAALDVTTVIMSDDSPTGYYVTFRYINPEATRVRIFGEWLFTDPNTASTNDSTGAPPTEWKDGYVEWNASLSWPTDDMVFNGETGVWSYTIPLPNGFWNYRFLVGGSKTAPINDLTGAEMIWDPGNPPYVYEGVDKLLPEQYLSAIFVPYDEAKQSATSVHNGSIAEQTPRDDENGIASLEAITLDDGREVPFGVYLPYGFDAEREEPYPVFVMFHGGHGAEGSWFTNGLVNILDNMIAEGRLEPTVVITPKGSAFLHAVNSWDRPVVLDAIVNDVLPYVAEKYNTSQDPSRRAFGGLSQGGATAMHAYFNNTTDFDYFVSLSPPMKDDVYPDYDKPEIQDVKLYLGAGAFDRVGTNGTAYSTDLQNAGVNVVFENDVTYGHQWALWRILIVRVLDNFLWK